MLVDTDKDFLVSQAKAKEKLAKVCEAIGEQEDSPYGSIAWDCAEVVRAADLSDCRVESPTWDEVGALHGQVESLSAQVAELKKELNVRKGDPVTRLHNICKALEYDKKHSPYSAEAWDQLVAENDCLRKEVAELKLNTWNVLAYARGALIEVSPCANPECQQIQRETLDWAIKKIDAAKEGGK